MPVPRALICFAVGSSGTVVPVSLVVLPLIYDCIDDDVDQMHDDTSSPRVPGSWRSLSGRGDKVKHCIVCVVTIVCLVHRFDSPGRRLHAVCRDLRGTSSIVSSSTALIS